MTVGQWAERELGECFVERSMMEEAAAEGLEVLALASPVLVGVHQMVEGGIDCRSHASAWARAIVDLMVMKKCGWLKVAGSGHSCALCSRLA